MLYFNIVFAKKRIIFFAAVLFFLVPLLNYSANAAPVPGQLVVKFKPGVIKMPRGLTVAAIKTADISAASVQALNAKYNVTRIKKLYQKALEVRPDWTDLEDEYMLVFPEEKDVRGAAGEYGKDPNVVRAEINSEVRAFETIPNDPYYSSQWALPKINAPQGWDRSTGTQDAFIAVLDTGINYAHEDLYGKVDINDGYDFVNSDADPLDDNGHGTAVAGVLGAISNNGKGIAGMDWNAAILPLKVLDSQGRGSIATVNTALAYLTALRSVGKNVVVANMSLGQYNDGADKYIEENPLGLKNRCQDAYNQGIVLVAAAGNGDVDWNTYPAYYPTVLAVAAVDAADKRSVWSGIDPETGRVQASNYADWVDVSAPGTNIRTTDKNGGYSNNVSGGEYWNGTSFASPLTAGLAALAKAANPEISNQDIMYSIKHYSDNIDSLQDPPYVGKLGAGRINALKTLTGLLAEITYPSETNKYVKALFNVMGTASGWDFSSYTLDILKSGSVEASLASSTISVESGVLGSWDTGTRNGDYTIRLRVQSVYALTREALTAIVVDNIAPEAAISEPGQGSTVTGEVTVSGDANDLNFDNYVLEYGFGASPSAFFNINTGFSPVTGGLLGKWQTAGLKGEFTLRLRVYDKAGNTSQSILAVNVTESAPTKEVQPQASLPLTYTLPNPFVRSATSEVTFNYYLEGNFNTTIYLFDLNGSLVWSRVFVAGENGAKSGGNNPSWNGNDLFGSAVSDGVFVYQVTSGGKVLARGKIIVLD